MASLDGLLWVGLFTIQSAVTAFKSAFISGEFAELTKDKKDSARNMGLA